MDLFHDVDSHLSQPRHVCKYIGDGLDWLLDWFINIDHRISLNFNPVDVGRILLSLLEILLWKQGYEFPTLSDISLDFMQTLISRLDAIVNDMQKTSPF